MSQIWISAAGLCGASIIGSFLGFLVKNLPHKWNDTILGYCAGIMLAASTIGLIVPAFDLSSQWWWVAIGVMVGALFLNVLDLVTPHLHHVTGLDETEHHNNAKLNNVLLFVMAIALHKLPEGMAAGVSISDEASASWTVSLGIALQNNRAIAHGWSQASPHFPHLGRHWPARDCRCVDRFWHGQYLTDTAACDAGIRWRCDALCDERRNDSGNSRSWLSEAGNLCSAGWIHDIASD